MRSNLGRFHRPMSRGLVNNMLMMNNLGDGSTLSLDFTTGVLDPRLTFTRSTTATYINSSGYVTTMGAAPTNDPTKARFNYDPTTLAPLGLLIEGAATNLTKFSETFTNAYWNTTANNVTAADSVATSPTGVALTASTLTEIAGTVSRHVHQLVGEFTPAASTAYTMSCFVKQPTSNAIRYVQLVFWSAGFGLTAYMNYDLQTGTVGTGGAGITASSITQYPNGWYRITARATSVAVPGVSGFQLGFSTTSGAVRTESYTASAPLKSIQLFGAQVEIGFGASSYISTGASQVTRNTDSCLMSGTNFSSWFNNTEGTCLFVGDNSFVPAASNFATNWSLISAANSLRINNYTRHTSGRLGASARDPVGTALTFDSPTGSPTNITTTAVYKTAFALKTNDFAYCVNGNTVGLGDASNGVFETVTSIEFARDGIRNGHIKQFKFYPTRLTNAQLQALTAP